MAEIENRFVPQPDGTNTVSHTSPKLELTRRGLLVGLLTGISLNALLGQACDDQDVRLASHAPEKPQVPYTTTQVEALINRPAATAEIMVNEDGTLSSEQLKMLHIEITQANEVQLALTKSALTIPLLLDARNHTLGKARIVLIDGPTLGPDYITNLSEDDKAMYNVALEQTRMWAEYRIKNKNYASPAELSMLNQYKNYPQSYLGELNGTCINGLRIAKEQPFLIQQKPYLAKEVAVFLAVGGIITPDPERDSHPDPARFTPEPAAYANMRESSYVVDRNKKTLGFNLIHEMAHYHEGLDESLSDTYALRQYKSNYAEYQRTHNTNHYPFRFNTRKGITIA